MLKIKVQHTCLLVLVLLITACSGEKNKSTQVKGETNFALHFLREAKGQYPSVSGLFENEELKSRMQVLMAEEYDSLSTFWNVETPIKIEDNVMISSGCEQHNCPNHMYYLVVNLESYSINIYAFKQNYLTLYTEDDVIPLPSIFSKDLDTIKKNAKVRKSTTQIVTLSK